MKCTLEGGTKRTTCRTNQKVRRALGRLPRLVGALEDRLQRKQQIDFGGDSGIAIDVTAFHRTARAASRARQTLRGGFCLGGGMARAPIRFTI